MPNNIIERTWKRGKLIQIDDLKGIVCQSEAEGHVFRISGKDADGADLPFSGTVSAVFLRPDMADVAIVGSMAGGVASVTLPDECYDIPGRFGLTVYVSEGDAKTAVYAAVGTIIRTSTGTVAPESTADVIDLINRVNAAIAAIPTDWAGMMADIAPTYSTNAVYPVGAYVYYDGDLYRCTTAITTAEAWTASHWTAAVIGNDLSDLNSAFAEKPLKVIADKNFTLFEMPVAFTGTFIPVNIYSNGEKYTTDFDVENFKNTGGDIYYVAPIADGGISTNDGLSRQKPKNLYNAVNTVAADGDTVYLLPGIYTLNDTGSLTSNSFNKSINIIGLGRVVWCVDGVLYKAQTSKAYDDTNHVWTCSRSSVGMVISSQDHKFAYTKTTSLANCQVTPMSWYFASGTLYINDTKEPDAIIITARDGIVLSPTVSEKLYFENILFVGGRWSVQTNSPSEGTLTAIFNNCIFTRTYGSYSNVSVKGGNVLFNRCEASFSSRDGFAYSPSTGATVQFVEIDCIGENNGLQHTDSQSVDNGSTAHSGATGIRINGIYQNNWGANVADAQNGTMSVNLGCFALDSNANTAYNAGFSAQQPGATMWLYGCKASGNIFDIDAVTTDGQTSTLYAIDCDFQTMRIGAGNIVITGGRIIQSGSDLNDYTEEGVYKVLRGSVAQAVENCPVTTLFVMEVYNMDTIYTKQIIYADNGIYSRRKTSDTVWGAWRHADLIL